MLYIAAVFVSVAVLASLFGFEVISATAAGVGMGVAAVSAFAVVLALASGRRAASPANGGNRTKGQ